MVQNRRYAGQAPGMDVWEGVGGKARPGGSIKGRGGRQRMEDRKYQMLTQNMSDDAFLNDMSGLPLGYEAPLESEVNTMADPVQVLLKLLQQFGMERDFSGGNIRPTDFGDESLEFGDEGMTYPGQPAYYKPAPGGLVGEIQSGGGAETRYPSGHIPVWPQGTQLPPLSPELMNYQLNNNPPNAVPTEYTGEDDQPGTRYEQNEAGEIVDEYTIAPKPLSFHWQEQDPKRMAETVLRSDFGHNFDPRDGDAETLSEFFQTEDGRMAWDILSGEERDPENQEDMLMSLFYRWVEQKNTIPEIDDMNNTRIPNRSYP